MKPENKSFTKSVLENKTLNFIAGGIFWGLCTGLRLHCMARGGHIISKDSINPHFHMCYRCGGNYPNYPRNKRYSQDEIDIICESSRFM